MILEYQRYGRNKETLINNNYISSGEYRKKYDNATEFPKVNKSLYDAAKKALKHRSGTVFEDMYWIDANSGEVICSVTDSTDERTIIYSNKIKNIVSINKNIITLHTHPSSMPPSIDDFNSCCKNSYKMGFVACHNGKLYRYTSNEIISKKLYEMYINVYLKDGADDYEAQHMALKKIMENYEIYYEEVINNG